MPAMYWPGRDQRQRGAAAPLEPAADINQERRKHRAVAEQAEQQPVPDVKRPHLAGRRHGEPQRDHRRAEDHGAPDADAIGEPAHQDAAEAGADPGQRGGERGHLALRVEIGGDRLQPDDDQQRRTVRDRQQRERGAGGDPRAAAFDRSRPNSDGVAPPASGIGRFLRSLPDFGQHRLIPPNGKRGNRLSDNSFPIVSTVVETAPAIAAVQSFD